MNNKFLASCVKSVTWGELLSKCCSSWSQSRHMFLCRAGEVAFSRVMWSVQQLKLMLCGRTPDNAFVFSMFLDFYALIFLKLVRTQLNTS